LSYWEVNRLQDSLELLNEIAERAPLYKPAIGNRAYVLASMGRADEATAKLDEIEPFMPGDQQILGSRAWIDFSQGRPAAGLKKAAAALELAPNDRTNKVSVNQGRYETHQYELVFDDDWSGYHLSALFNLGRIEEATIEARRFAARGQVDRLFALLNANNQPELLVDYLEEHWTDLESFREDVPANSMSGYREMVDIAYAYRKTGNQAQFSQAMAFLDAGNQQTYAEGNRSNGFFAVMAAYHALAGDNEQALDWLAQAVDGGWITSSKISKENPYFRELDGNPEYEAIQARMIDHLNRERAQLDLEPVST